MRCGFELSVTEELRDGKWTAVAEAGEAYGVTFTAIRCWMNRTGFEHHKAGLLKSDDALAASGALIGRSKLNALPKENNLLVEKRNVFRPKTARRNPSLPVSLNIVNEMELTNHDRSVRTGVACISTGGGVWSSASLP